MRIRSSTILFLTCLVFVGVARADVLVPSDGNVFQNSLQNPCIIYGPGNCDDPLGWNELGNTQGNFNHTTGAGPNAAVDDYVITLGELRAALGYAPNTDVSFLLGVDLNQTNDAQTRLVVEVFSGGTTYYTHSQDSISTPNQGTGWADYVGATDYDSGTGVFTPIQIGAAVSDATVIQFRLALESNDGPDQLFLIRPTPDLEPVPEPGTMLLLGSGFGLITTWRRRK
jgi:hypothetical protein